MPFKIATFNVNGVNGRLPRLVEWLRETEPNVVCLQELKTDDKKFPIHAIESAGYGAIWHGQKSYHGVAILAKGETPTEVRRGLPGEPEDKHTRYIEAKVKGLTVASVYLPNGNPVGSPNYDYKLRWFDRFVRYTVRLYTSGEPVIVAGDLNVIPTDFDIYNPSRWRFDAVMQPAVRAEFQRLLGQGWTDAVRRSHPAERMYTYWVSDDAFHKDNGFRLDFLLLSAQLKSKLIAAGVDREYRIREKPSDHTPTWVNLRWPPPSSASSQRPMKERSSSRSKSSTL